MNDQQKRANNSDWPDLTDEQAKNCEVSFGKDPHNPGYLVFAARFPEREGVPVPTLHLEGWEALEMLDAVAQVSAEVFLTLNDDTGVDLLGDKGDSSGPGEDN